LQMLGVDAKFEGRNDVSVDGKKISGNAEHIFKNKVLHHGTLLFSSQMKNISEALRVNPLKYVDKAVKSIPKRVTNISSYLKEPLTIDEFAKKIMDHILASNPTARMYEFSEADIKAIAKIRDEKYATYEWNYGYSPSYSFQKGIKTTGGTIEMNMDVERGVIKAVKIFGDFFNNKDIAEIEQALRNVTHKEEAIRTALAPFTIGEYFRNITIDDLIEAMF